MGDDSPASPPGHRWRATRRVGLRGLRAGRRLGLRSRLAATFALGALLVSIVLASVTATLTRGYLVSKRESLAITQAAFNARVVASNLAPQDSDIPDVLGSLRPPAGGASLVYRQGRWYSTSLGTDPESLPAPLREGVLNGRAANQRIINRDGTPVLIVGLPVPRASATYFEVVDLTELDRTLRTQSLALAAAAAVATMAGAVTGVWASRRVLGPLTRTTRAASAIAAGDLTTRLPLTGDGDIDRLSEAFNEMAVALAERMDRDARFASDVSHELRSPLTSLSTAVQVLDGRQHELPPRARAALSLVTAEVQRFQALVTDLLEISRYDAGAAGADRDEVPIAELVRRVLGTRHRQVPLEVDQEADGSTVLGDKRRLERVVANLLDNADQHGSGATRVTVSTAEESVVLHFDDDGPGVPPEDRQLIFERFARSAVAGRRGGGSGGGVGLGLALVREHVRFHGGTVHVEDSPAGGARFTVELPRVAS